MFNTETIYIFMQINEAELASLATFISLGGVGVSLINALDEEVAFLSLMSAAPMWEVEVKSKWKPLSVELAGWLEEQWRADQGHVELQDLLVADLEALHMSKPFMGALRRVYYPALWLQYRQSQHHTYLHTKIHRLQVRTHPYTFTYQHTKLHRLQGRIHQNTIPACTLRYTGYS